MNVHRIFIVLFLSFGLVGRAHAQTSTSTNAETSYVSEPDSFDSISIVGKPQQRERIAGSAHFVDETKLETFEYNDIHRVLSEVPGVYVRGEDGYGLRPNIGLRGASSDRSSKLTLMEDGVLLGPAPYAAPAAYYFPLTTRMTGVEVFKGPASVKYGPNTIGGALNLQTRSIPKEHRFGLDVSGGADSFLKAHSFWGLRKKNWGVLVEGVRLQTNGFKELDGGGNTGFEKNEFMGKARYNTDPTADVYHQFDLKLGYSTESSNETYLGLSQEDFDENPYRRYISTQKGNMSWYRSQVQLRYTLAADQFDVRVTAYRNDFNRDWTKLNGFNSGPTLPEILKYPNDGQKSVFFAILRGEEDSNGSAQGLVIGSNLRDFVSQGVEVVTHFDLNWISALQQRVELGARLHIDGIRRDHSAQTYLMQSKQMVADGDKAFTLQNSGDARSIALHLHDEIRYADLLVTPGIRTEFIHTDYEDRRTGTKSSNDSVALLPGIGLHYQLNSWLGVLGGVHRGFSPVAPGQSNDVVPELSLNYEGGLRAVWEKANVELIGFFNDYSNLTSICTLSSGCPLERLTEQFNAGAVQVYGAETALSQQFTLPMDIRLATELTYTLTISNFVSDLIGNPRFGDVTAGDELPYVPKHQASGRINIGQDDWNLAFAIKYLGEMRDVAGAGEIDELERIPGNTVIDAAASYTIAENYKLYFKVDNLTANEYAISLRPYGLRPGRPLQVFGGLKIDLGE